MSIQSNSRRTGAAEVCIIKIKNNFTCYQDTCSAVGKWRCKRNTTAKPLWILTWFPVQVSWRCWGTCSAFRLGADSESILSVRVESRDIEGQIWMASGKCAPFVAWRLQHLHLVSDWSRFSREIGWKVCRSPWQPQGVGLFIRYCGSWTRHHWWYWK